MSRRPDGVRGTGSHNRSVIRAPQVSGGRIGCLLFILVPLVTWGLSGSASGGTLERRVVPTDRAVRSAQLSGIATISPTMGATSAGATATTPTCDGQTA